MFLRPVDGVRKCERMQVNLRALENLFSGFVIFAVCGRSNGSGLQKCERKERASPSPVKRLLQSELQTR